MIRITIAIVACCCVIETLHAAETVRTKPLAQISGANSKIKKAGVHRILSSEELDRIWSLHVGDSKAARRWQRFEVDFSQCMVVAVFGGESVNSDGITGKWVVNGKEKTELGLVDRSYQSGEEADHVTPYGFFVLRRSIKPLLLKLEVLQPGARLGGPTEWQPIHEFPAIDVESCTKSSGASHD